MSGFHLDEALAAPADRTLRRLPRLGAAAFRLVWRSGRAEFLTSAVLQVAAGIVVLAQLLIARVLLEELLDNTAAPDFRGMFPEIGALAGTATLLALAATARSERQRILGELVARHASMRVIGRASVMPLIAYDEPGYHDRLQRASANASARPLQMTTGVLNIVASLPAILAVSIALLFIEPLLLALAFGAYIPVWLAATRASRHQYRYSVEQTERDRRRSYLYLILTRKEEAAETRAFGFGPWMLRRYRDLYDRRIADLRTVSARRLRLGVIAGILSSLLAASTFGVLIWFVSSGRTDLASAGTVAAALLLLGQRVQSLVAGLGALYESSLFLEDYSSFVGEEPMLEIPEPATALDFERVRAEGVSFRYPGSSTPVLRGVTLEIERGQVVALVGENGSGKSTFAKVLAGLYAPEEGEVRWDDTPADAIPAATLRATVTVALQDFARFDLTVRENIALGRLLSLDDHDAIVAAARQSGAWSIVESLPAGLETWLGPEYYGGTDLSVGEWQRLALARTFLHDAPMVILDEPSAALDPRAEAQLFDQVRTLLSGRSVLLISHRFSTVRRADRIHVLEHGEIIESGTHDELMERQGRYAELFLLQAQAYR